VVRRELHRYRAQTGFDIVERQELFEQLLSVLERAFPAAATPGQTLSRGLQELRDAGELEFLDHGGTCRLRISPALSTDSELLARTLVDRRGTVLPLEGPRPPVPGHLRERNAGVEWL